MKSYRTFIALLKEIKAEIKIDSGRRFVYNQLESVYRKAYTTGKAIRALQNIDSELPDEDEEAITPMQSSNYRAFSSAGKTIPQAGNRKKAAQPVDKITAPSQIINNKPWEENPAILLGWTNQEILDRFGTLKDLKAFINTELGLNVPKSLKAENYFDRLRVELEASANNGQSEEE